MKNISAWAIRHPLPPVVLFVVLLFMGVVAFVRLPVTADPDVSFPAVYVGVGQPGAAPQELEAQVMQKIEGAVAGIGNIDSITSWAVEGQANMMVQFEIGTPIDRAVADVRDAMAKVRVQLPQGIQEPAVQRVNADGGPMVFYAVSSSALTEEEISWFVDNTITKRLLSVTGVAQVQRGGGVNREIRVELDPARMQALGITAAEVNEQLRTLNLDSPGGRAQVGGGEQSIRVLGGARTAAALGEAQIALSRGRFARLSDLAEVRDSVGEIRSIARLNGRPATTFSAIKAKGYSDVSTDNGIQAELAKIRKENPHVTLTQVYTSVDYTKETYHSALSALVEGSVLAVLVVFLFLRNVRATLISALAIPMSAIPAFAFMQWMDFTLNSISLLALSLVAGVLVDDAIVEIENIVRHMRMGKSGYQAALDAADQIGLAVVATSATIVAVFVPVSFMGGLTGQYFKQFGLTVAAAVFFSLLVARIIARQPEVRDVVELVGTSDEGVREAEIFIALIPAGERRVTQRQWEDRMLQELKVIPDAQLHFNRNGNGRDVNIYITGDDPQLTYDTARKVVDEMGALPFVQDARINNDLPRPEILIHPHLDLASQLGVTVERISETIRIATLGDLDQNSAKFSLSDRQVPIRVSLIEDSRKSLSTLENLPVPTSSGSTVPLKAVADISFGEGPTRVRRYNQSRRLFIDADLKGAELGPAMKAIYNLPTLKHLPQGVHRVEIGDSKYMNELIGNMLIAMATGILMVFAVLVLLFARVLQPITILFSLPLSFGGVALALVFTRNSMSLGVFIGLLMLMGIVAKNSILFVDFAIEEMRAGKDRLTAILESGHKRARPIVMTTVAMIAGMLPVALGLGGDKAFREPMAIAVIGGLITSTALTLVIVPAAFTLIDDIERWLAPRFGRVLTAQPPPAGAPAQPRPVN